MADVGLISLIIALGYPLFLIGALDGGLTTLHLVGALLAVTSVLAFAFSILALVGGGIWTMILKRRNKTASVFSGKGLDRISETIQGIFYISILTFCASVLLVFDSGANNSFTNPILVWIEAIKANSSIAMPIIIGELILFISGLIYPIIFRIVVGKIWNILKLSTNNYDTADQALKYLEENIPAGKFEFNLLVKYGVLENEYNDGHSFSPLSNIFAHFNGHKAKYYSLLTGNKDFIEAAKISGAYNLSLEVIRKSKSRIARQRAVEILGLIRKEGIISELINTMMKDRSKYVRGQAAKMLTDRKDEAKGKLRDKFGNCYLQAVKAFVIAGEAYADFNSELFRVAGIEEFPSDEFKQLEAIGRPALSALNALASGDEIVLREMAKDSIKNISQLK